MKKLKVLLSVLLSAMLVLSLVVPSMASDYVITVSNAKSGETYKAYKIFNLSYTGTGENAKGVYTATLAIKNLIGTNVTGVTITDRTDADGLFYVEMTNSEATAKALADFLYDHEADLGEAAKSAEASGTTVTLDVGSAGYFFVTTTQGTLAALSSTVPTAAVTDKNKSVTVTKKIVDGGEKTANNVSIGDTVNFKSTVVIPVGSKTVVYHDKMETGFTLGNTITVKNGSNAVTATNYTITKSGLADGCTFEIAFKQTYLDGLQADTTLTIEYSATLNEKAEIKTASANNTNDNTAWATWGANQKTSVVTTKTTTVDFDLFKYTMNNTTKTPLKGAEFKLYTKVGQTKTIVKLIKEGDNYRVAKTGETGIELIQVNNDAAKVNIKGLDQDLTYVLEETKSPEGYNRKQDDTPVVFNATVEVENNQGAILPTTGGTGTKVLFTVGGIMMVVAFVLITSKRRMAAEK